MSFFSEQPKPNLSAATHTNRSLNANVLSWATGDDYAEYCKEYVEIESKYQQTFSGQVNPIPTVRYL